MLQIYGDLNCSIVYRFVIPILRRCFICPGTQKKEDVSVKTHPPVYLACRYTRAEVFRSNLNSQRWVAMQLRCVCDFSAVRLPHGPIWLTFEYFIFYILMLICCQKDTKKAWNVTLSNVLEGTTNPNNTNERNAHAYRDAGVQSFFTCCMLCQRHNENW